MVALRRARVLVCAAVLLLGAACTDDGSSGALSEPGWAASGTPSAPPASTGGTPTPPATSRASAPAQNGITMLFSGDMLVHDKLREQAGRNAGGNGYDFRPMLARVAPIISRADWAVCHQETPISADNSALSGYPNFNAPYQLASAEKAAGYDSCTTASNHTVDKGQAGVAATLAVFDRVRITHVGSARSAAEAQRLTIYPVRGVKVGHLSYTYGLNGQDAPNPWTVNLIDPARIRADAARIRRAGAQFVVVSLHFGTEQDQTPSTYQRQVADQVMASPDVDLIVGHHAHVVQPIQRRADGRWVIFGLGNFLAQQTLTTADQSPPHRDGVLVTVTIGKDRSGRYRVNRVGYVPTFVTAPSDVVTLAPGFSRARTSTALRRYGAPIVDDTPR